MRRETSRLDETARQAGKAVLVCAAVLVCCAGARRAQACSCVSVGLPQFLLPDTVVVPSNIGGIPLYYPGSIESLKHRYVKIEKYARWHRDIVPHEIVEVKDERFFGQVRTVVLLRPVGGFEPDSRYRVTYHESTAKGMMEVRVLDEPFTKANAVVTMVPGEMHEGMLQVAAGGSCSATIRCAQVPLTARFESRTPNTGAALLYFWDVDGLGPYLPRHSVCELTRLGGSWTGRNTNLIYSRCDGNNDRGYGLAPGTHEIRVVAWLPGTSEVWEASELVDIRCDSTSH